jgi:hypothetical protein
MIGIAVITQRAVIDKILDHVGLSLSAQPTVDGYSVRYEVPAESIPPSTVGVDPEPDERGPPASWEGIDPPSPDQ